MSALNANPLALPESRRAICKKLRLSIMLRSGSKTRGGWYSGLFAAQAPVPTRAGMPVLFAVQTPVPPRSTRTMKDALLAFLELVAMKAQAAGEDRFANPHR